MRHRRSVGFAALVAMDGMVVMQGAGPALGQSADPSAAPPGTIELPTTLFDAPAGDAPAIRWSGDGEGQAGRGQVPFRLFASGSQLDEAAAALGLDPETIVGDRGYARGADPDTVYAIDVVIDPTITANAWTHEFITGEEWSLWPSWDQLDTAVGPVIYSGWHGGFRWATDGLAVEVMPIDLASDQLDEVAPLRTFIRSQTDAQGHRAYRQPGPKRLAGRDGAVLRSRSGDHLVVIVTSGPAVTIFSGKASGVDQVMATYPFAVPGTVTPDPSAAGSPTPSCAPTAG